MIDDPNRPLRWRVYVLGAYAWAAHELAPDIWHVVQNRERYPGVRFYHSVAQAEEDVTRLLTIWVKETPNRLSREGSLDV